MNLAGIYLEKSRKKIIKITLIITNIYSVWNTKSYIVNKIAEVNPFGSSVFIYSDSGAWRDRPLYNWPNSTLVRHIINDILGNKMLFAQVSNSNLEKHKNFPGVDIIEATFFMGTKYAINNFNRIFWTIHDERFLKGIFVGKEQDTYNLVNYNSSLSKNESFRLQTWGLECKHHVDIWFFYQYFLANDKDYKCIQPREKLIIQ